MRHANNAELTVVISPLVPLMVDQVDGMRRRGIDAVVTLNSPAVGTGTQAVSFGR